MLNIFLFASLPELTYGVKPEITSAELFQYFEINLGSRAASCVKTMRLWFDLQNMYGLLVKGKVDDRANYSETTLKTLLANQEELPAYVFEFISRFDTDQKKLDNFPWLFTQFFAGVGEKRPSFLVEFLEFERSLRLIMTAYRAKRAQRDVAKELQYEEIGDPLVDSILAQKDSGGAYIFPYEWRDLEKLVLAAEHKPFQQYEVWAKYRFNYYLSVISAHPFTLRAIVAYMACLWILEDYFALHAAEGEQILNKIVERKEPI